MPTDAPFEEHADRYEAWFDAHEAAYRSELDALGRFVAAESYGLEIGVGTGRFAGPLGVEVGIDPSPEMLGHARDRGVDVVCGVAERLPFLANTFETALLVTTICFVDDVPRTLAEADRVLGPDGSLVVGYIDADSPVGQRYREAKEENPFYREATFVSTDDVIDALGDAGFTDLAFVQTISRWPGEIDDPEPVASGYGEGSFIAVEARR